MTGWKRWMPVAVASVIGVGVWSWQRWRIGELEERVGVLVETVPEVVLSGGGGGAEGGADTGEGAGAIDGEVLLGSVIAEFVEAMSGLERGVAFGMEQSGAMRSKVRSLTDRELVVLLDEVIRLFGSGEIDENDESNVVFGFVAIESMREMAERDPGMLLEMADGLFAKTGGKFSDDMAGEVMGVALVAAAKRDPVSAFAWVGRHEDKLPDVDDLKTSLVRSLAAKDFGAALRVVEGFPKEDWAGPLGQVLNQAETREQRRAFVEFALPAMGEHWVETRMDGVMSKLALKRGFWAAAGFVEDEVGDVEKRRELAKDLVLEEIRTGAGGVGERLEWLVKVAGAERNYAFGSAVSAWVMRDWKSASGYVEALEGGELRDTGLAVMAREAGKAGRGEAGVWAGMIGDLELRERVEGEVGR